MYYFAKIKLKNSALLNLIFLLLSMLITKYAENKICDRTFNLVQSVLSF
jgi:hypothetical protein